MEGTSLMNMLVESSVKVLRAEGVVGFPSPAL